MNYFFYTLLALISFNGFAQQHVLSYKEFITNIVEQHPIAKSAKLQQKIARAKLTTAKGGFDPVISSQYDHKDFEGKDYFEIFKNKITIPTPIGINLTGGFENTNGVFLNPENNTTGAGLLSAGVEVDVIQGLFTNVRKTTLKQAKIYQNIALNKQQQLLNKLIYKASKAYASWQQYNQTYTVIERSLKVNQQYLKNVKSAFNNGEKTAMDTLEASVYLQNSQIELVKYKQLLSEKKLKVENHMWLNNKPIGLKTNTIPEYNVQAIVPVQSNFNFHLDSLPVIAQKIGKRKVLDLKRKLTREKLKPKLKVKYNALLSTKKSNEILNPEFNSDYYKVGAKLEIPILYRKERGKYKESKLKVQEMDYDIAYKKTEITNKISIYKQNQTALNKQISLLKTNVKGYRSLLTAENIRFKYGESSLFLINKRQEKLIESEIKLLKSQNKLINNYLDYMLLTNHIF